MMLVSDYALRVSDDTADLTADHAETSQLLFISYSSCLSFGKKLFKGKMSHVASSPVFIMFTNVWV